MADTATGTAAGTPATATASSLCFTNTGSGQDMYGMPPATGGWQDESFLQEDEQQQPYFSDSEQPVYNPKDYEDYIDFPQSMLEPKYSPYQPR